MDQSEFAQRSLEIRMRVLAVTNMFPTTDKPLSGVNVFEQIRSLELLGITVKLIHIRRDQNGRRVYLKMRKLLSEAARHFKPDLVHCFYGGILAKRVVESFAEIPVVLSFCGSDLLGVE